MNKKEIKIIGIAQTLAVAVIITSIAINYFQDYEWALVQIISILIGFMPTYLVGGKYPMLPKESMIVSLTTFSIYLAIYLLFAPENYQSITSLVFLATPIVCLFSYIAFKINDRRIFKVKDFFR